MLKSVIFCTASGFKTCPAEVAASVIFVLTAASVTFGANLFKACPNPYPVRPDNKPFSKSPVAAYVPRPEPTALARAALLPKVVRAVPKAPVPNAPPKLVNKAGAAILPNKGAKNGKNASSCPVSGFLVIGKLCRNPFISIGLTCNSIESPYLPAFATFFACCLKSILSFL